MRRTILFTFLIIPLLFACSVLAPEILHSEPIPEAPAGANLPTATGAEPSPAPIPTEDIRFSVPAVIDDNEATIDVPFTVQMHPDRALYTGDLVSLEVIAGEDETVDELSVQVETPDGVLLGPQEFGPHGIGRRTQATLLWAWDTSELSAGEYLLTFSLLPEGFTWTETVSLLPASEAPYPEPDAHWATVENECCKVHYISGTAAERDLTELLEIIDEQADSASELFGIGIEEPISITFLPRILGHGGFASEDISISYLDRNYAASSLPTVIHHEMVHKLDGRLGGDFRPSMLVEGLAVALTGGHFKPEPLMPRAAALIPPEDGCMEVTPEMSASIPDNSTPICTLNWYIPLAELADDFYLSQHEIGYLQAGALVEYMMNSWGREAFDTFYRDIQPDLGETGEKQPEKNTDYQMIDRALQEHFGLTLIELEKQFLISLAGQPASAEMVNDVRYSVRYYDAVRHYQQLLDPSAYFLTAWLTNGAEMREREIVADFLRHPEAPENIALETMLAAAYDALLSGDYSAADRFLDAVDLVLESIAEGRSEPFMEHSLAADYLGIVNTVLANSYNPQRIQISDDLIRVWATKNDTKLQALNLARFENGWVILLEAQ